MPGEKIRILVIDDDVDLLDTVRGVLQAQGYDVLTADGGEQGLEVAYTERPNLVLLDVMMPGMDGYQVCRELQFGYTKDIPVVFLTAKTQLAHMMEANRSGASAFVTKPFRVDHLVQTVKDVLRDASVYFDEITGLPTLANVQVEVQRMLSEAHQLGIIYASLDGMDALEEVQGFEVADEVFRSVGRRLTQARGDLIRGDDFISVSSLGNAFLIVLSPAREHHFITDDDLQAIKRRLEDLLLRGLETELEERLLTSLNLYVGVARLTQSPKVRFRRALLKAIAEATEGIRHERAAERHRLQAEFERVIRDEQVTCVYHPIVRLEGFEVMGFELLARGPQKSELHHPEALFDVARSEGRVSELDRLCRLMATRGSSTLPEEYLRFINTEPMNLFHSPASQQLVKELVAGTPSHLRDRTVIEVTEKSVIDDFGECRDVVAQLREHGFRIAVDDAGAGYSGLQTIVEIEPDFIKLDISLTRGVERSLVKQKLVRTLRDFCREAGIVLIAEGIETQPQLDALVGLEIPYGQGFLFARPGSPYPLRECLEPSPDAEGDPATASDA